MERSQMRDLRKDKGEAAMSVALTIAGAVPTIRALLALTCGYVAQLVRARDS